ncbi:MAG TPA: hypothetical protein VL793_03445, partial [Patescibacteria group bacterium]|nr:hypothetical protein [Patescibacteria group bacterium]
MNLDSIRRLQNNGTNTFWHVFIEHPSAVTLRRSGNTSPPLFPLQHALHDAHYHLLHVAVFLVTLG